MTNINFKNLFKGLLIVIAYITFQDILIVLFNSQIEKLNTIKKSIVLLINYILVTTTLLYLFKNKIKEEFKTFKINGKNYIKENFKYYGYGFLGMMIFNLIINVFIMEGIATNEAANRDTLLSMMIYAIPVMAIMGPINEELIFKKSFDNTFKNPLVFILFTGLLFGSAHVLIDVINGLAENNFDFRSLLYILPYSSLGVSFSYIYIRTKNIFTNISFHIIHNSLTVLLLLIALA